MRKLMLLIPLVAALFVGMFCLTHYLKHRNEITGAEWFREQADYVDQLQLFADEMDDTVALYLSNAMDEADFLSHIGLLEQQIAILKANYSQRHREHPVKLGTDTYHTKKGYESVEAMFPLMEEILGMLREYTGLKSSLSYHYLAYHQEVIDTLSDYIASFYIIQEDSKSGITAGGQDAG